MFDLPIAELFGADAAGLSATNIVRLTNEWETECRAFQKRSASRGTEAKVRLRAFRKLPSGVALQPSIPISSPIVLRPSTSSSLGLAGLAAATGAFMRGTR